MYLTRLLLASSFLPGRAAVLAWQYVFKESDDVACHEPCFTTDTAAFQTVKGPVWMSTSPRDPLDRSVLSAVNGSAWEQWFFDAVSTTADHSLGLCVSRDASYTMMGHGILRVEFFLLLANGTIVGGTDFVDESQVQDCCGEVRAEWRSVDRSYSFRISKDYGRIEGEFHRPEVDGRFSFDAITPPRFADGSTWPSDTASNEMSPFLRYTEPMSAGRAELSFTLAGEKQETRWEGLGGHNRFFSSKDWFSIVKGWNVGRARVGPYVMSLWEDESRIDGQMYQGSVLFKDGEPLVRARLVGNPDDSPDADYLVMSRRYGGARHSNWGDMSTGWALEFVSPSRGQTWQFSLEHKTMPFEVDLGGGRGLAGFTEVVSGGEVGGKQYGDGYGVSELVVLPESMSIRLMLSIWWQLVAGSGANPLTAVWKMVSAPFR